MTGEKLLSELARIIETKPPANPADSHFITRKDLVDAIRQAAESVGYSDWEDYMGEEL